MNEPYPHAVKARLLDTGIVKFPVNVHSITVEKNKLSGYTTVTAKQNDLVLHFVIDEDACRHLAALLTGKAAE
jgi:hypothetical protein